MMCPKYTLLFSSFLSLPVTQLLLCFMFLICSLCIYCFVLYVFYVRLSHINKDYLLTYLVTSILDAHTSPVVIFRVYPSFGYIFTTRKCGLVMALVAFVCNVLTIQSFDLESSFMVCRYIFGISRLSLYIKLIGSRSRSQEQSMCLCMLFVCGLPLTEWRYFKWPGFCPPCNETVEYSK